jgi:copper chaperone CopZ
MTCSHCEATIKKEILKNDKEAQVTVNLKTKEVSIESNKLTQDNILTVLDQIGYDSKPLS